MKIGQVMCFAASFNVSFAAFLFASFSSAEWLRRRNVLRVSSGRPSQICAQSNGPESAMQALNRFS